MPSKRAKPPSLENALRGGVSKTTTRYYGSPVLSKNLVVSKNRIAALQRQLRALKDVIAMKAVDRLFQREEVQTPSTTRKPDKQLRIIANQTLQNDITNLESQLTSIETRVSLLGTNLKEALNRLDLNRSLAPPAREQRRRALILDARKKKVALTRNSRALGRELSALRSQLSGIALATTV